LQAEIIALAASPMRFAIPSAYPQYIAKYLTHCLPFNGNWEEPSFGYHYKDTPPLRCQPHHSGIATAVLYQITVKQRFEPADDLIQVCDRKASPDLADCLQI
jgi:hypothetical protein